MKLLYSLNHILEYMADIFWCAARIIQPRGTWHWCKNWAIYSFQRGQVEGLHMVSTVIKGHGEGVAVANKQKSNTLKVLSFLITVSSTLQPKSYIGVYGGRFLVCCTHHSAQGHLALVQKLGHLLIQ